MFTILQFLRVGCQMTLIHRLMMIKPTLEISNIYNYGASCSRLECLLAGRSNCERCKFGTRI